jgi:purine-nucleoside phosphorylase
MSETDLYTRVREAANAIQAKCSLRPRVGIVLGTGLSGLAEKVADPTRVDFTDIPHFPVPRVVTHGGSLLLGRIGDVPVAALEGRCHFYEGYSLEEITLPVRVLKVLGIEKLILSNACGGLNPLHAKGDILLIDDHINLMGGNPLIGPNDERLGPRFPDMCRPYDPRAIRLAEAIALEQGIRVHRGVYAALPGPCLETRAEYRMLRTIGADVVGMSTVPEAIVAVHAGLQTFGIACITDLCLPDCLQPVDIDEIIAVASAAEPKVARLTTELVGRWQ